MKLTRKRSILLGIFAVLALVIGVAACGGASNPSGQQRENQQQAADTQALENNQPLPHFNWSQERQNMIDIETAQANDVRTTTFFMLNGRPDPIGSCPSIGFGIPDTASLSNPWQALNDSYPQGGAVIPIGQMDPTGIYAPTSSQGTFIICLTSSGQPYIDRIESDVETIGGNAVWDYAKHTAVLVGAPTAAAQVAPPPGSGNKKK